jgi:propionate CoA-transferase
MLELTEVAPGVDVQRDVLDRMAFRPAVSRTMKTMDARLFAPEPMGLLDDMKRLSSQARVPRRQFVPT